MEMLSRCRAPDRRLVKSVCREWKVATRNCLEESPKQLVHSLIIEHSKISWSYLQNRSSEHSECDKKLLKPLFYDGAITQLHHFVHDRPVDLASLFPVIQ